MDVSSFDEACDRVCNDPAMSETEKLMKLFAFVTESFITQSSRDLELARAMGDQDNIVKEHIKASVMNTAREILEACHAKVTGIRKGARRE